MGLENIVSGRILISGGVSAAIEGSADTLSVFSVGVSVVVFGATGAAQVGIVHCTPVKDFKVKPALFHLLQGRPLRSRARSLSFIAPVFAFGPGLPCAVCGAPFINPPPGTFGSSLTFFLPGFAISTPGALVRFVPGFGPGIPRRFSEGGRRLASAVPIEGATG